MRGEVPRYPGLWLRGGVYAATVSVVVWAAVTVPQASTELSATELVGATLAATVGYLFPVGVGPVGLWRARKSFVAPPLILLALTGSVQVTVLAWAVAAVLSGIWIRRSRFTPGRMAIGASTVTLGATAAALVVDALDGAPLVARGLAGVLAYNGAYHVVRAPVMCLALGGTLGQHLRDWDVLARAWSELTGMVLGVAALLLRDQAPVAMLLLVLPYGATIAAGLQRIMLQHARRRDRAMTTFIRRLQSASSPEDIDALVVEAACEVLDAPSARIGLPPGPAELGVRWRSSWLVAEDRRIAPTFNRPYRSADTAELDSVVAAATQADETLSLLARLEAMSTEDPLTSLPNRRGAEASVDRLAAEARRRGEVVALVVLDVDDFKRINDRLGHAAGDDALRQIGRRLQDASRASEVVARWGGEEFVAFARCDSAGAAHRLAERLRAAASGSVDLERAEVGVTLSAGVSVWDPAAHRDLRVALDCADAALYQAKRDGKARTVGHETGDGRSVDPSELAETQ